MAGGFDTSAWDDDFGTGGTAIVVEVVGAFVAGGFPTSAWDDDFGTEGTAIVVGVVGAVGVGMVVDCGEGTVVVVRA